MSAPTAGRRKGLPAAAPVSELSATASPDAEAAEPLDATAAASGAAPTPVGGAASARPARGGWGDEPSPSSAGSTNLAAAVAPTGRRQAASASAEPSGAVTKKIKLQEADLMSTGGDGDEIPVIPDLEDDSSPGGVSAAEAVAEAPVVRSLVVQTLKELDKQFKYALPQSNDPELDLTILTRPFASANDVFEEDVVWDHTALFTDVMASIGESSN